MYIYVCIYVCTYVKDVCRSQKQFWQLNRRVISISWTKYDCLPGAVLYIFKFDPLTFLGESGFGGWFSVK